MVQLIEVDGELVEFPDDMSDAEIAGVLGGASTPAPDAPGQAESAVAGVGQGGTFGFGDEIYGALASISEPIQDAVRSQLFDLMNPEYAGYYASAREEIGPRSYEQYRDDARGINAAAQEANPWTYGAAEIGTGLAGGLAGGARAAAGQAFKAAVPRLAGVGAAYGGVSGAGFSDADTAAGVAGDTALGAGVGAVLGTALPGAGAAIGKGVQRLSPKGRAKAQMLKDLRASGLSDDELADELARNPNLNLTDLSATALDRLGNVAGQSNQAGRQIRDYAADRAAGQGSRMETFFARAFNGTPVHEAKMATRARTRATADPLYEQAHAVQLSDGAKGRLAELYERDPAAVREAVRTLRRGSGPGEFTDSDMLTVSTADKVSSVLYSDAQRLRRAGDKAGAASYEKLRDNILAVIDPEAPTLPLARKAWRSGAADDEALELGTKVFSEFTPDLKRIVGDMSESELTNFRVGVFQKVDDMMARKGENADLSKLFRSKKEREALRLALGSENLYQDFLRAVGDEEKMYAMFSRTLNRAEPATAFGQSPAMAREPTLSPFALGGRAAQGVTNRAAALPNRAANQAYADLATSASPQQTLQQLVQPQPLGAPTGALASPAAIDPGGQLRRLLGQ